jgi:hypothetical protein
MDVLIGRSQVQIPDPKLQYVLLKKVKESRYRPGVAKRVPGSLGFQIFVTFGT